MSSKKTNTTGIMARQLAAEREAREKAEAKCGCAMELIQKLLDARSPDVPIEECSAMIHHAQQFLSSTEPPALLKEVDGLRQQVRMDTETIERIRAAGAAGEANLALARATIRFLNQSLELAVDALVRYGEHDLNCPVYRDTSGDCDCGWTDTLPKLNAAVKDANHDT